MVAAATATMTAATSLVFVLATVGPLLVDELDVTDAWLGGTVAAAFVVAASSWKLAAGTVERLGARKGMAVTAALAAAALGLLSVATGPLGLVAAGAVAGLSQALVNPATNLVIAEQLTEGPGRATAVGVKQAGVPLGALVAGAVLPTIGDAWGWRAAVGVISLVVVAVLVAVLLIVPGDEARAARTSSAIPPDARANLRVLFVFQLLLGIGNATISTYLPLFATDDLATTPRVAGTLILVIGATGIAARVLITRLATGDRRAERLLPRLTAAATVGTLGLAASPQVGAGLAWLGAFVVGGSAVAANAVTMLIVIQRYPPPVTARATGLVAAGFFTGFATGPALFGLLVDVTDNFPLGWLVIAAALAAATVTGYRFHRLTTPQDKAPGELVRHPT